ncbi:MAG TPA: S1/P1 Nuclease, partial [Caulobacteraceae bacterium]
MAGPNPSGRAFAVARVAAGAAELRDLTVAAWAASARGSIGYPAITVEAIVKDGLDPYDALYGED